MKKKFKNIRCAPVVLIRNKHDTPHYANKLLTEKDMGKGDRVLYCQFSKEGNISLESHTGILGLWNQHPAAAIGYTFFLQLREKANNISMQKISAVMI